MVKIQLLKTNLFDEKIITISDKQIIIKSIPSPKVNSNQSTEVVYIDNSLHFIDYIIYKPKISENDLIKPKTIISFIKELTEMQSNNERLLGDIQNIDYELFTIYLSADFPPLPVFNNNDFNIKLPKIPNTNKEFIVLFDTLYRVIRTSYKDFKEEVSCKIIGVLEEDKIWDELKVYGVKAMLEII